MQTCEQQCAAASEAAMSRDLDRYNGDASRFDDDELIELAKEHAWRLRRAVANQARIVYWCRDQQYDEPAVKLVDELALEECELAEKLMEVHRLASGFADEKAIAAAFQAYNEAAIQLAAGYLAGLERQYGPVQYQTTRRPWQEVYRSEVKQ